MSDTPRTDEFARRGAYTTQGDYTSTQGKQIVHIDDCRKLETELNAALAALEAEKTATCDWTENELLGHFETACKTVWEFECGTPESNRFQHCPKCGRKVVAK